MIVLSVVFSIYLILVLLIGRQLAFNDVLPKKKPDTRKLQDYNVEDITFLGENDVEIKGWLVKSNENFENKTIILLHGWMSTRLNILEHLKLFVDNGYHVFTYDQRSHGHSGKGLVTYGKEEGKDLLHAIDLLRNRSDVNMLRMGAVSFSLGTGTIVATAANQKEPLFKAIVLEGIFSSSYDVGEKILKNQFGSFGGKVVEYLFFNVGVKFWSLGKFQHFKSSQKVKQIDDTPIFIVRGNNDELVPKKSATKFISSVKNLKEVWIHSESLPEDELGHVSSIKLYPNEYKKRVVGFLDANI